MYLLKQRICSSPLLIHKKNKPTTKIYLKVAFPVKVMALTPLQKSVTSFAENYGNIVAFILWDFTGKDLMVCRLLLCSHGDNLLTHFGFSPPLFYFFFFFCLYVCIVWYISLIVYAVHDWLWVSVEELMCVYVGLLWVATGTFLSPSLVINGWEGNIQCQWLLPLSPLPTLSLSPH